MAIAFEYGAQIELGSCFENRPCIAGIFFGWLAIEIHICDARGYKLGPPSIAEVDAAVEGSQGYVDLLCSKTFLA